MPDEDGVRRNRRVVRSSEHVGNSTGVARAIEDLYEDRFDVVVVRDAVPAGPLDRLVDRNRRAEIVAGDDQALQ